MTAHEGLSGTLLGSPRFQTRSPLRPLAALATTTPGSLRLFDSVGIDRVRLDGHTPVAARALGNRLGCCRVGAHRAGPASGVDGAGDGVLALGGIAMAQMRSECRKPNGNDLALVADRDFCRAPLAADV